MALHRALGPATGGPSGGAAAPGIEGPVAGAVEVYHRTYTSLLRSSGETRLRVLEASHRAMESSLHSLAASPDPDLGAFLYANRRLPAAIVDTVLVVMGQSLEVFARAGISLVDAVTTTASEDAEAGTEPASAPAWRTVDAAGRRRRWYIDGAGTMAVLIASASDVDDLVPTLVAYQIEWNKLHDRLRAVGVGRSRQAPDVDECSALLGGAADDWAQLAEVWGPCFDERLAGIAERHLSLRIRMLGGSQVGYARETRRWWAPVARLLEAQGLEGRPVYFVSSNSHSLVNLVSGTVALRQAEIVAHVRGTGPLELRAELARFEEGSAEGDWRNFLYFAGRLFYGAHAAASAERRQRRDDEQRHGVFHVSSATALDVSAQVIVLDRLSSERLDPRLEVETVEALRRSPALVVNIDYPLGVAAYNILREVAESVSELRGVYILGKAATLNADVGDVMISSVVHDEHSRSTYWLDNAFSVDDIAPFLRFGSGLDNQRAVTVKGTFLQNRSYLDFYYREGFTVVEAETGPYCAAVYEMSAAERNPAGEPVNFSKLPVDLGIIHYASDTPFTQARTLGARGLSYHGMDSTYASSIAILRRILGLEGALGRD